MFSIKPNWAKMIATGEKTYELRRRPPPESAVGRIALIYSTAPESRVICACRVIEVITEPKDALWDEIGNKTGCSRSEYMTYFVGLNAASAIQLSLIEQMFPEISRRELISKYNFTPPQSWRWAESLKEPIGIA